MHFARTNVCLFDFHYTRKKKALQGQEIDGKTGKSGWNFSVSPLQKKRGKNSLHNCEFWAGLDLSFQSYFTRKFCLTNGQNWAGKSATKLETKAGKKSGRLTNPLSRETAFTGREDASIMGLMMPDPAFFEEQAWSVHGRRPKLCSPTPLKTSNRKACTSTFTDVLSRIFSRKS
ncbi:hypothetical protein [Evtepia sp.]|uniref:hypothetical protein n=1 Tax=Evtepia sp. TaxID=2773933 RepID=UPI002A816D9A|nr:hypothetical protein [Evtepia sp.]MDY4430111.1 hypothetical protein [Evtepia sp.]